MTTITARTDSTFAAVGVAAAALGVAVGLALTIDIRLGVALAFGALLAPIALLDLPVVVALWAALTVFSRVPGFGLATSAAAFLVLGAWIAHARTHRASIRASLRIHRRLLALVAVLLVWLTLSLAWSQDQAAAASRLPYWYINGVALAILLTSLRTPRDVRLVVIALVLSVLAALGLALAGIDLLPAKSVPDASPATDGRLQGAMGDPNFTAAMLVPVLVLCTVMRCAVRGRARSLLLPAAILLVLGLAMTQSRGGMLAALAALIAAMAVMRGHRPAVFGVGAAALLTAAIYLLANPAGLERIQSAEQDRGNGREDLWLVAQRMSGDNPVLGVGLANFTVRSREFVRQPGALRYVDLVVDRPHAVHNTYLEMLAETGAVGLALFLAVVWSAVASAIRAGQRFERAGNQALALVSRGVGVANIGLLTAAIFISAQGTATVWVLLALGPVLLGVACARSREPVRVSAAAPGPRRLTSVG